MSSTTKNPYQIILRPIVTEKSVSDSNAGKYIFAVSDDANKYEIAWAVEQIQKDVKNTVNVVAVNTIKVHGKVRHGRFFKRVNKGKTSDWRKAVVTLKAGQTIELVEGV